MAFKMKKPSMTQGTAKYKAACDAMQINRDMDASSLPDGRAKSSAFQKSYEQAYKDAQKLGYTKKNESKEDYIARAKDENREKYGTTEPTKVAKEQHGGSKEKLAKKQEGVKSEVKEREAEKKNPKLMPAGEGVMSQESKDKTKNKIAQNTAKNTERTADIKGDKKSERKARKAGKKLAKAAEARESGNIKKAERKERKAAKKMEKASATTKYGKSMATKPEDLEVGNRKNLPDALQSKISAAPKYAKGMPKYKSDAQRKAVHASKADKK